VGIQSQELISMRRREVSLTAVEQGRWLAWRLRNAWSWSPPFQCPRYGFMAGRLFTARIDCSGQMKMLD
jgi:hypothetical protein